MKTKLVYLALMFRVVVSSIVAQPVAADYAGVALQGQVLECTLPAEAAVGNKSDRLVQPVSSRIFLEQPGLQGQPPSWMSCSGDECGCSEGAQECRDECQVACGGNLQCLARCNQRCNRAVIDCSIACCEP
jgi:hypothetical protein